MGDTIAIPGIAYAYANFGRWVTDCPGRWCSNAMQVRRGQDVFECLGMDSCGRTAPLMWPPDPDAIETILAARPANRVRNWLVGETLAQLIEENAAHDCLPAEWTELTAGTATKILEAAEEVVIDGTILPAVLARRVQHAINA